MPCNFFKDPYLFDFLGLKDDYLENDLEAAILRELEKFILEFGRGKLFFKAGTMMCRAVANLKIRPGENVRADFEVQCLCRNSVFYFKKCSLAVGAGVSAN